MSEPQPRESKRPKSPLERRDEVQELYENPEVPDQELIRAARAKMPWGDWVLYEYGPYWLAIGAILLDLVIVSEIAFVFDVKGGLGILMLAFFTVILIVLEWYLYSKYWPKAPYMKNRQI